MMVVTVPAPVRFRDSWSGAIRLKVHSDLQSSDAKVAFDASISGPANS